MSPSAPEQTPRERREQSKAALARELTRILFELDMTQRELADACGVKPQHVSQWCDKNAAKTPGVGDVLQMPTSVAHRLLAWMGVPHQLAIAPVRPASHDGADYLEHLRRLVTEGGDVTRELSVAMADGRITVDEARRVLAAARENISVNAALANRMEEIVEAHAGGEVVDLKRGSSQR